MICVGSVNTLCLVIFIMLSCIGGYLTVSVNVDDWGPWTDWSVCSKTCGYGVVYRQRSCHIVNSSETSCKGTKKQFKVCQPQKCGESVLNKSVTECSKQDSKTFGGKTFTWEPFINPYKRCELSCKAKGHHYYSSLQIILSDGTSCKHDNTSFCLAGTCMSVGCDRIMGSEATLDQCGVCDGNGKSCQVISGIFTRSHLEKYGHNFVTKIPKGACNINITEMGRSRNYIALKITDGKYIMNDNKQLSRTGNVRGVGTEFRYYRNTGEHCPGECIYSSGPTNHSIDVEVLYYHRNPGIVYQFTIPHEQISQLGVPSSEIDSTKNKNLMKNRHRTKSHRKHRKHQRRHGGRHKKVRSNKGNADSVPEEQRDRAAVKNPNHKRTKSENRLIIRRRIDADKLNPRIQYGQSPRYIPSERQGYQQQVLSSYRNHHQNQFGSRYSESNENNDRLNSQSVRSRTGQYTASGALPSSVGSAITIPNTNEVLQYPHGSILESHDRNIIDNSGLYSWRISGFTECSRSCGGGNQETRVLCMKGISNVKVTDENCNPASKPQTQIVECNNSPCPPDWFSGNWSACSVTCGTGKQNRLVECRRGISRTLDVSVSASLCLHKQRPHRTKRCDSEACASWKTGNWSKCSAECGHGQRTRDVTCVNIKGQLTDKQNCSHHKPKVEEICDMGSCAKGWYHAKWSEECSSHCGRGYYTRNIYCAADDGSSLPDKKCPVAQKPKTKKSCKSSQPCGGSWFAGPWNTCNATCGIGAITRGVVCMKKLRSDVYTIVKDENCLDDDKPASVKGCEELPDCGATWYMTDYNQCSKSCGTGVKRREVKCLNSNLEPDMTCDKENRPSIRQSCNKESCSKANHSLQKDSIGDDCKDSYPTWCQFVRQARICGYEYYQKQCCATCQKHS